MPFKSFCAPTALALALATFPLGAFAQAPAGTAPAAGAPSAADQTTTAAQGGAAAVTTDPEAQGLVGDGSPADGMDADVMLHFVPILSACVSAPNETDCGQVRALVTECAADLNYELCDVLFEDADEVFADPALLERAQITLARTSESIAQMRFDEADGEIGEAIEATRALSERTLLRGAENLNSHSSPPVALEDEVQQ